jgi:hypothetical protein
MQSVPITTDVLSLNLDEGEMYEVCQWLAFGGFSPGTKVFFTNKADRHDITEISLKVALNTIKLTNHMDIVMLCNITPVIIMSTSWLGCNPVLTETWYKDIIVHMLTAYIAKLCGMVDMV